MIEKWNSDCFCINLDSAALRAALQAQAAGLARRDRGASAMKLSHNRSLPVRKSPAEGPR